MMVAWTGHRPDVFLDPTVARLHVDRIAGELLSDWTDVQFVCGGQRGVDAWAADAAMRNGVALHLILPIGPAFMTRGWADADRAALLDQTERAATVTVVDERALTGQLAYDRRNEALVQRCDLLVAVWSGIRRGGTFYTLCAARIAGRRVQQTVVEGAAAVDYATRGV
jgi:hypothetical protein